MSVNSKNIDCAKEILVRLGLPKAQQNERSALCLLALVNLDPQKDWSEVENPLMGITPIMKWISTNYSKEYAPNTRETIRKDTIHQFLDAAIVVRNPDDPERPVNSPKTVYQIEDNVLKLLRTFDTVQWNSDLEAYLEDKPRLVDLYSRTRELKSVLVEVDHSLELSLSPGDHSNLTKAVVEDFCSIFAAGCRVIYVGDTGEKFAHFAEDCFNSLGIDVDPHGKMPDVIIYCRDQNRLFLVEAVTSRGPIDGKRHNELTKLFGGSMVDLVFVTAFPNKCLLGRYLSEISWETEVWIANDPSHLIHFDGEQFLSS